MNRMTQHFFLVQHETRQAIIYKNTKMQKRINQRATLPMTTQDANADTSRRVGERRQRRRSSDIRRRLKWVGLLFVLASTVAVLHRMLGSRFTVVETYSSALLDENADPLDQFPSVQYALQNSKIVLLYFAASWCPMSTPVTKMIDEKLGDLLLPPQNGDNSAPEEVHDLSLVFISSDRNDAEMQQYIRRNWMAVPFDSKDRNNIKRHFETCAKKEMSALKIARKREIPTLIVLAGHSRQVLTYAGVDELREKGEHAVDHWMQLLRMSDAMKSKYS
jgi:hypothetical protein